MSGKTRTVALGLGFGAALVMGLGSLAWACTSQAWVGKITPGAGPAGTRATVTGENFVVGPVEIRWNTSNGPLLTTATGPRFSVAVTIPDARPDVYPVVAISRQGGRIVGQSSTAFEVTPANATARGGYSSASGEDATTTPESEATTASGSARAPRSTASTPGDSPNLESSAEQGAVAFPSEENGPAEPGGADPGRSELRADSPRRAPATAGSATATASAGAPLAGGVRGSAPAGQPVAAATSGFAEQQAEPPSARTVWGDPASGFAEGDARRGVSLLDAHNGTATGPSPAALGATALSFGLVAMFSGFGLAEVRRRRASAIAARR